MTTAQARQPKGTRSGGQFAETSRRESTVKLTAEECRQEELSAERNRPLTLQEVEYLQKHHGTYDPGEGYYARMPKVFEAAAEKAANTDDGRLILRRRAQAEQLAQYTGIPAPEIHSFFEEVKDLEPMSEGWENLVQTWSQYVWNRPRGEIIHIEDKMRAVHGKPDVDELMAQRDALTAQIDAQHLNQASVAIRRRYPTAAYVEANEDFPGEVKLTYWDEKDNVLGQGGLQEVQELGHFDLIPMNYDAEKSPLRFCVEHEHDAYRRTLVLDRMAAVTADDLLQS
jgi:hypothetical protein